MFCSDKSDPDLSHFLSGILILESTSIDYSLIKIMRVNTYLQPLLLCNFLRCLSEISSRQTSLVQLQKVKEDKIHKIY